MRSNVTSLKRALGTVRRSAVVTERRQPGST
jgi:hypothetical protein